MMDITAGTVRVLESDGASLFLDPCSDRWCLSLQYLAKGVTPERRLIPIDYIRTSEGLDLSPSNMTAEQLLRVVSNTKVKTETLLWDDIRVLGETGKFTEDCGDHTIEREIVSILPWNATEVPV